MNDERKAPENPPEYPPETTGTRWLPIAEVEELIGKKERNARYWLDRHNIPVRGDRPKLFSEQAVLAKLTELDQPYRKAPEHIPEATGMPPEYSPESTGTYSEPIEAAYRVTGEAAAEIALVPLATMVEELRGLADQLAELARRNEGLALEVGALRERQAGHDAQLAAKEAALIAKDETIIAKDELIADLRTELHRRAERDRLAAAQAAQDGLGVPGAPTPDNPSPDPGAGFWARVRRVFGGGEGRG